MHVWIVLQLAGTPPGSVMIDGWVKSITDHLKVHCPDDASQLAKDFRAFFKHSLKKGDDFTFERRPDQSLYAFYEGETPQLVSSNACLGRALVVGYIIPLF